jgi:hypothetical protein
VGCWFCSLSDIIVLQDTNSKINILCYNTVNQFNRKNQIHQLRPPLLEG